MSTNNGSGRPQAGTRPSREAGDAHVCMIAYTDYAIDARVRREAETLAANGFQVRCLTTKNGDPARRFVLEGVEVRELPVTKYRGKSTRAYLYSYLKFLAAASAACLKLMARDELDVVHVHNLPDFLVFAGLVPRLAGRKVILDVHDSVPETFAAKFSNAGLLHRALCLEERVSALVAHRVICVNHPQRDTLVGRGIPGGKTFISMNVPDPKIFQSHETAEPASDAEAMRLVYHGTMAHRLGVDLLIRAVARVKNDVPGLELHLWGHGDDLPSFTNLATELGVADLVRFNPKGYPIHELPERLRGMDLGVIGNRRSAACDLMLPVKLLEYVSLGIPTVVPRLKTIEHYFTNDMVTYYEPENVDSLAAAIRQLHERAEVRRRQAEQARQFLAEYGWERQGQELVRMYRTLVEN